MEILTAAYILANVLVPLLGVALLPFKRTRNAAVSLVVVPSAAVGGGLFGFWGVERILYGRLSPQREINLAFYLGWIVFYVLSFLLALGLLLFRRYNRPGAFLKSTATGIAASFISLACLAVSALVWRGLASRYGAVGWDPVSVIGSTPAWHLLPVMLIVFAIFFVWSKRRLRAAPL